MTKILSNRYLDELKSLIENDKKLIRKLFKGHKLQAKKLAISLGKDNFDEFVVKSAAQDKFKKPKKAKKSLKRVKKHKTKRKSRYEN